MKFHYNQKVIKTNNLNEIYKDTDIFIYTVCFSNYYNNYLKN